MGMFDNIRNIFKGPNNATAVKEDDRAKKVMLATEIINLVDKIKRVNSFDSSIWNLSNASSQQLQRRSVAELESLRASLSSRIEELTRQSKASSSRRESLEASKWTGQRPQGLTEHEFDRFQRDDER